TQIAQASSAHAGIVTLAACFWLLYLAAGVAFQLRVGPALASAPASFLTGGALFGGVVTAILYSGTEQGVALLIVAAVYVALAAALFVRARDTALLVGLLGVAVTAVGVAQVLSGSSVTYAWAAEAALLAWLTSRVRDSRFQLPALAYLVLAAGHALSFEASPNHFFRELHHPANGAPALLAVAFAAVAFGLVRRSWQREPSKGILRVLDPLLRGLEAHERTADVCVFSLAGVLTAYAASLALLAALGFQTGHVVVTGVWSLAATLAVGAGLRSRAPVVVGIAFAWLAVTIAKVVAFDVLTLT